MISTDFAPNELRDDASISLITLFQPWLWRQGKEMGLCIDILQSMFPRTKISLFLSGRASLYLLLKALHLSPHSTVALVGFTCEAVVLPIQALNLKPLYIDIEKDMYSMDLNDLKKKISDTTSVIVLQHTFGIIPKYRDEVLKLAKERNIYVIEDLAHGFDPSFWQKQVLSDSQALLLSFGRSKALSSVFGGAVVTSNHSVALTLASISQSLDYPHFYIMIKLLLYKPISYMIKIAYNIPLLGKLIHKICISTGLIIAEISKEEKGGTYSPYLEKKYPNALAKLLLHQLNKFDEVRQQRKMISDLYIQSFGVTNLTPEAFPRFPILIKNRPHVLKEFAKRNIFFGSWYSQPVAPKELLLEKVGYIMGSCPVAEQINKEIINLPTLITEKEAEGIVRQL